MKEDGRGGREVEKGRGGGKVGREERGRWGGKVGIGRPQQLEGHFLSTAIYPCHRF